MFRTNILETKKENTRSTLLAPLHKRYGGAVSGFGNIAEVLRKPATPNVEIRTDS
jgi:hypothetical protein